MNSLIIDGKIVGDVNNIGSRDGNDSDFLIKAGHGCFQVIFSKNIVKHLKKGLEDGAKIRVYGFLSEHRGDVQIKALRIDRTYQGMAGALPHGMVMSLDEIKLHTVD